jgi:hypothetical protein
MGNNERKTHTFFFEPRDFSFKKATHVLKFNIYLKSFFIHVCQLHSPWAPQLTVAKFPGGVKGLALDNNNSMGTLHFYFLRVNGNCFEFIFLVYF